MSEIQKKPQKYLVLIGGPTAVGKTDVSVRLAKLWDTEIISADSRQVYREMSIGTAKPDLSEMDGIVHHLIDERSIGERFSAADFETEALRGLDKIFRHRNLAIATGGTGLYFKVLADGLDLIPSVPEEIVRALGKEAEDKGLNVLVEELKSRDPEYVVKADIQNPHRVIRALSVCRFTSRPFSSFLQGKLVERPFQIVQYVLTRDRDALYARINERVDRMIEAGLEEEVRSLYKFRHEQALQTVGYKEFFPYFDGNRNIETVIELIKRNSRRYAKRQMTWFRNQGRWETIDVDRDDPVKRIEDELNSLMTSVT